MKKLNFLLLSTLFVFFVSMTFGQNLQLLQTPKKSDMLLTNQSVERRLFTFGYDDGTAYSAIGYNSAFTWWAAIRIPASTLSPYANGVTRWQYVQVAISDLPVSAEVGIYKAGSGDSIGDAVAPFQSFTPTESSWNTISLTSNPLVTATDVWVICKVTEDASTGYPIFCDNGPSDPNGFWLGDTDDPTHNFDISSWNSYNWMLRGIINTGICPGDAMLPSPADGSTSVDPTNVVLGYTLPGDENSIEVFFSQNYSEVENATPASMVYAGASTEDIALPFRLTWSTYYYWRVVTVCDGGKVYSDVWQFSTQVNPDLDGVVFTDDFEDGLGEWNVINNDPTGETCVWDIFAASDYQPTFALASGDVAAADADYCGSGSSINTTLELATALDCSDLQGLYLKFDSDFRVLSTDDEGIVEASTDGGSTWMEILHLGGAQARNQTYTLALPFAGFSDCLVRFTSIQPGWDWWWAIDNVEIGTCPQYFVAGDVKYDDVPETELIDFDIYLDSPVTPDFHRTGVTDADGFYMINYVADGPYDVTAWGEETLPHLQGSINTHDAWQLNRWWQKIDPMPTGVAFDCSDLDNNGAITSADAQALMNFLYNGYYISNGTYHGFNKAFSAVPNWVFDTHRVFVDDWGIFAPTIYARAAGDADGSGYVFSRKNKVDKVSLATNSTVLPLANEISIPFYTEDAAEIGAMMLKLNYNSDAYEFVGVSSKIGVNAQASEGNIGVFYIGNGVSLNEGDEAFSLTFKVKDTKSSDLALAIDKASELVNKDGKFVDLNLSTPQVGEALPTTYELTQNFPNPFNPTTKVSFSLPQADVVTLKVYDMLGAEVATLVNGKMEAGKYEYEFNASSLPSGVYVYRIITNNFTDVKKMMLLK